MLAAEGIFTLNASANVPQGDVHLLTEIPMIVRSFSSTRLPLPPYLFAGAWLRFDNALDVQVVAEAARLLAPGALMAIISACTIRTAELIDRVRTRVDITLKPLGNTDLNASGKLNVGLLTSNHEDIDTRTVRARCDFCPPWRFTVNEAAKLPGAAATLWGDEHFLVIPDIAPIGLGHLLLLPTHHYLSMAATPYHLVTRLKGHMDQIHETMQVAFGRNAIFIEHGAVRAHDAGSCIDHAHWHCLPDYGEILKELTRRGMQGTPGDFSDTIESHRKNNSYFLVRSRDQHLMYPSSGLPCQFLRLMTAKGTSGENFRWQHAFRTTESRLTYSRTLSAILPAADVVMSSRNKNALCYPEPDVTNYA